MQKIPNEDELVKKALQIGAVYAKKRAYGEIESHDSMKLKVEFVYKVLIEDKLIQPLAKDQIRSLYNFQDSTGMIADCVFRATSIEKHNWRDTKPP